MYTDTRKNSTIKAKLIFDTLIIFCVIPNIWNSLRGCVTQVCLKKRLFKEYFSAALIKYINQKSFRNFIMHIIVYKKQKPIFYIKFLCHFGKTNIDSKKFLISSCRYGSKVFILTNIEKNVCDRPDSTASFSILNWKLRLFFIYNYMNNNL